MTAETISPHQTTHNYFVPSPVSEIKFGKMRFLITDRPTDMSLDSFIKELERHNTKAMVRVCDSTYNDEIVKSHGIDVKDWEFNDGSPPPKEVIQNWIKLVSDCFNATSERDATTIAVHCVAGLGRSPLLVAIALLEAGMPWADAVYNIRSQRRGALNERQLEFLRDYKPTGQLRKLRRLTYEDSDKHRKSCAIM